MENNTKSLWCVFLLVCWAVGIFLELIYDGVEKNQQYGLSSIPQRKQDQRCLLTLSMLHSEVSVGIESDSVPFFFLCKKAKSNRLLELCPWNWGPKKEKMLSGRLGTFSENAIPLCNVLWGGFCFGVFWRTSFRWWGLSVGGPGAISMSLDMAVSKRVQPSSALVP